MSRFNISAANPFVIFLTFWHFLAGEQSVFFELQLRNIARHMCILHRDAIYAPPLVISLSCRLNSCGLRAFSVLGPRLWNSLPRLLRDTSHNTTSFGHSLKTFFLSKY